MSPFVIVIAVVIVVAALAIVLWLRKGTSDSQPTGDPAASEGISEGTSEGTEQSERRSDATASVPPPSEQDLDEEEDDSSNPQRLLVTGVGLTDVGLRRKLNQDAYVCMPEHDLYALADGMGAHAAGEVASKLTLEAITDAFERNKFLTPEAPDVPSSRMRRLVRIIERANEVVYAMSQEVDGYRGMGTTVVMINFSARKGFAFIAHAGDSRCYRIRDDQIKQITVDHTLGAVGIMGKTSSLLSRAVGIEPNIDVEVSVHRTVAGDVYLLCSDGLSRMVSDEKILATIRGKSDLDAVAKDLIAEAKAAGGKDNVTAVLIRIDPAPETEA